MNRNILFFALTSLCLACAPGGNNPGGGGDHDGGSGNGDGGGSSKAAVIWTFSSLSSACSFDTSALHPAQLRDTPDSGFLVSENFVTGKPVRWFSADWSTTPAAGLIYTVIPPPDGSPPDGQIDVSFKQTTDDTTQGSWSAPSGQVKVIDAGTSTDNPSVKAVTLTATDLPMTGDASGCTFKMSFTVTMPLAEGFLKVPEP